MFVLFLLVLKIGILFFALTVHEYAHGYVAYRLGDYTAKYSGRLTFNPLAHIDPFGTIAMPILSLLLLGFPVGWAKPVPINFWALNQPKKDILWVGIAGPCANILTAIFCSLLLRLLPAGNFLFEIVASAIVINLIFAVFNLVPIPPLDGSRVVFSLLPSDLAVAYMKLEKYGFVLLLFLMYFRIIGRFILPIAFSLAIRLGVPYNFFW